MVAARKSLMSSLDSGPYMSEVFVDWAFQSTNTVRYYTMPPHRTDSTQSLSIVFCVPKKKISLHGSNSVVS